MPPLQTGRDATTNSCHRFNIHVSATLRQRQQNSYKCKLNSALVLHLRARRSGILHTAAFRFGHQTSVNLQLALSPDLLFLEESFPGQNSFQFSDPRLKKLTAKTFFCKILENPNWLVFTLWIVKSCFQFSFSVVGYFPKVSLNNWPCWFIKKCNFVGCLPTVLCTLDFMNKSVRVCGKLFLRPTGQPHSVWILVITGAHKWEQCRTSLSPWLTARDTGFSANKRFLHSNQTLEWNWMKQSVSRKAGIWCSLRIPTSNQSHENYFADRVQYRMSFFLWINRNCGSNTFELGVNHLFWQFNALCLPNTKRTKITQVSMMDKKEAILCLLFFGFFSFHNSWLRTWFWFLSSKLISKQKSLLVFFLKFS